MTWYAYAMIALIAVNMVASVLLVGQPRKPSRPIEVLGVLVFNALFIWGIVELAIR